MNKTYKYVTLGVMVVCLIGLLWSGWRLERTIENMNQTIQEIEQIEKKIDLLEKELISEISMGMSSGYPISEPMCFTRGWAVAVGPGKYICDIVTE